MAEGFKVDGLDKVRRNLRAIESSLPRGLTAIHREVASPVADRARSKVRSRSGRLAASIRPTATQKVARVTAGARMVYGAVNHWGGYPGTYPGNEFLTEAINEMEPQSILTYDRLLTAYIEGVWVDG